MTGSVFDLSGREALITGASGYLGRDICLALARAGAHVLVNARTTSGCEDLVEEIEDSGANASAAPFDISDEAAVADFVASRADKPLHILVNNAYSGEGGTIATAPSNAFRKALEIGLVSPHHLFQSLLPQLRMGRKEAGDASVINIASMYGLVSPDLRNYHSAESSNPPFYGAAKAALVQYTRYAACEFGPEGIRVNAVAPGPFPALEVQQSAAEFIQTLAARVPLGRIGQAHEIGGPVTFLASSAATFVTGIVLSVDGGWTCW